DRRPIARGPRQAPRTEPPGDDTRPAERSIAVELCWRRGRPSRCGRSVVEDEEADRRRQADRPRRLQAEVERQPAQAQGPDRGRDQGGGLPAARPGRIRGEGGRECGQLEGHLRSGDRRGLVGASDGWDLLAGGHRGRDAVAASGEVGRWRWGDRGRDPRLARDDAQVRRAPVRVPGPGGADAPRGGLALLVRAERMTISAARTSELDEAFALLYG